MSHRQRPRVGHPSSVHLDGPSITRSSRLRLHRRSDTSGFGVCLPPEGYKFILRLDDRPGQSRLVRVGPGSNSNDAITIAPDDERGTRMNPIQLDCEEKTSRPVIRPLPQLSAEEQARATKAACTCKICMGLMVSPVRTPFMTNCGHVICYDCLLKFFYTRERDLHHQAIKICPICRGVLTITPVRAYLVQDIASLYDSPSGVDSRPRVYDWDGFF